jgi:hypothetical protein
VRQGDLRKHVERVVEVGDRSSVGVRIAADLRLSNRDRGVGGSAGRLRAIACRTVGGEDDRSRLAERRDRVAFVFSSLVAQSLRERSALGDEPVGRYREELLDFSREARGDGPILSRVLARVNGARTAARA